MAEASTVSDTRMNRTSLSVVAILFSTAAFAEPSNKLNITPAEHEACDPDARSRCATAYPDEDRLVTRMRAKQKQLSPACLATFRAGLRRRHMAP